MSGGSGSLWFMLSLSRRLGVCFFRPIALLATINFYLIAVPVLQGCANQTLAPIYSRNVSVEGGAPIYRRGVRIKPERYVVKRGDSLHGIAWRFGVDYRDLVIWNGISNSDLIYEGQILNLKGSIISRGKKALFGRMKPKSRENLGATSGIQWFWPASGSTKSILESGKISGLEIKGKEGDPIYSAAKGKVVYSGNGLKGYGELIIIKHNNSFLSAYAHSKVRLVAEGDTIGSKQEIARMGATGSDSVMLYFEIRRNGKAVNPKLYLPSAG